MVGLALDHSPFLLPLKSTSVLDMQKLPCTHGEIAMGKSQSVKNIEQKYSRNFDFLV